MNRTQWEALNGVTIKAPCKACASNQARAKSVRLERHRRNKEKALALKKGLKSGKVVQPWFRDEFTGWHYVDYKGKLALLGKGE